LGLKIVIFKFFSCRRFNSMPRRCAVFYLGMAGAVNLKLSGSEKDDFPVHFRQ
jgi:hypothetical protein